jgi:hypothetical protein
MHISGEMLAVFGIILGVLFLILHNLDNRREFSWSGRYQIVGALFVLNFVTCSKITCTEIKRREAIRDPLVDTIERNGNAAEEARCKELGMSQPSWEIGMVDTSPDTSKPTRRKYVTHFVCTDSTKKDHVVDPPRCNRYARTLVDDYGSDVTKLRALAELCETR